LFFEGVINLKTFCLEYNVGTRRRRRAEKQRLAFGQLVETILGYKEAAKRVRQTRGGRVDWVE